MFPESEFFIGNITCFEPRLSKYKRIDNSFEVRREVFDLDSFLKDEHMDIYDTIKRHILYSKYKRPGLKSLSDYVKVALGDDERTAYVVMDLTKAIKERKDSLIGLALDYINCMESFEGDSFRQGNITYYKTASSDIYYQRVDKKLLLSLIMDALLEAGHE